MQNKSTQVLIGVVVLVVIGIGGYLLYHKKSPTYGTSTSSTNSSSSSTQSQSSGAIVQTKTASNVGQYLADSSGNALYTYGADSTGKSNCSGSCLASWPAYKVTSSSATLPANVTTITRSDGSKQYAYKGMPLYTFTGDSSGQVTGDNVSDFHIAKP